MCGTADWRKGADIFVQLALHLKKHFGPSPYHCLWLGGSPGEHRAVTHDLTRAGLVDICRFIPPVPNPEAYLSAFDVFALTSREDPFPVAMLEAAAGGLPIVCFAGAGGAPELVENDAGIIVPYLDVQAMAQACADLLANADLRRQLGHNAKNKVRDRYLLVNQGPKILAVIQTAMGQASK
jgi:glycosyltransferase involved in cell wall biosynthesis